MSNQERISQEEVERKITENLKRATKRLNGELFKKD